MDEINYNVVYRHRLCLTDTIWLTLRNITDTFHNNSSLWYDNVKLWCRLRSEEIKVHENRIRLEKLFSRDARYDKIVSFRPIYEYYFSLKLWHLLHFRNARSALKRECSICYFICVAFFSILFSLHQIWMSVIQLILQLEHCFWVGISASLQALLQKYLFYPR